MNNNLTLPQRSMMLLEQKEHLTKDQHYKLLEACTNDYNNKKPTLYNQYIYERNYFMLLTFWNTGARVSDVCDMRVNNIDTYSKEITYFVNKLSKKDKAGNVTKPVYHKVFLEDQYLIAFHNYIKKYSITGYLFTSFKQRDKQVTEQKTLDTMSVNRIVHKYARMAGFDAHPHMYRHGIAVEMLNNNIPIEIISKFLGHRSVETTIQFYAKITSDVVRRFVEDKMRIN